MSGSAGLDCTCSVLNGSKTDGRTREASARDVRPSVRIITGHLLTIWHCSRMTSDPFSRFHSSCFFFEVHNESLTAENRCSLWAHTVKRTGLLAAIQSVMSQQVSFIACRNPCCDITDWGRGHKRNAVPWKKWRSSDSVWRLNCGRQESLVVRNARGSCQFTVHLPEKNRQTIVGALNIRWNSIHLKSQGNQSLPRDEWLSSSQPLIWRDVASQERSQQCAVSNQHIPQLAVSHRGRRLGSNSNCDVL